MAGTGAGPLHVWPALRRPLRPGRGPRRVYGRDAANHISAPNFLYIFSLFFAPNFVLILIFVFVAIFTSIFYIAFFLLFCMPFFFNTFPHFHVSIFRWPVSDDVRSVASHTLTPGVAHSIPSLHGRRQNSIIFWFMWQRVESLIVGEGVLDLPQITAASRKLHTRFIQN